MLYLLYYIHFVGGFLAESASDFMQGVVMFFALTAVLVFGVSHAGGIKAVIDNARSIQVFLISLVLHNLKLLMVYNR